MMKTVFLFASMFCASVAYTAELQIELPDPQWLLSSVRAPLSQREASLQPREQMLANQLAPLLDDENYTDALALIENAVDLESEPIFEGLNPALSHLIGQIYLMMEDNEKAEAAFLAALSLLPDFVRAHQSLGLLYLREERFEDARKHITKTVSLGAVDANIYGYLGYLNQETNNPWGAISAYQQALMLEHDNPQWQQGLLYGLTEAAQYESALTLIDSLLVGNEEDASLWLYRAHAALQMDDNETAMTSLEMALRLGDDSETNQQMAAQVHLQVGSIARAVELISAGFNAGIDIAYLDQTLAWLLQQEQWSYADELIENAKQNWSTLSNTDKSRLLNREASIDEENDETAQAIEVLDQALALNPGNAEALIHLANIYTQENRYIQAEVLYERASVYDEFKEQALLGYAQLSIDQLDYTKALSLLREANILNPGQFALRENIQILENLVSARQTNN